MCYTPYTYRPEFKPMGLNVDEVEHELKLVHNRKVGCGLKFRQGAWSNECYWKGGGGLKFTHGPNTTQYGRHNRFQTDWIISKWWMMLFNITLYFVLYILVYF